MTFVVNGNLVFGRQLVSRPGRGGLNLDLSIYYNSKIWDRNSSGTMYVKDSVLPVSVRKQCGDLS